MTQVSLWIDRVAVTAVSLIVLASLPIAALSCVVNSL